MAEKYREILNQRLLRRPLGFLDAQTDLKHFALINYAVRKEKLEKYIPIDRFEIPVFKTEKGQLALISVVPFMDVDFHFPRVLPWPKFAFYQTNHRAYIIDKQTGQHAVWFFGTNLGTRLVCFPRWMWQMPWHYTIYETDCRYNALSCRYEKYQYNFRSKWCDGTVEIEDTSEPTTISESFSCLDEMKLILTHPVSGFFRRSDNRIGSYKIWHPEMTMTKANPKRLYFSLYENLGIMNREEMSQPHSIFLCPKVEFDVHLPPQVVGNI